MANIFLITDRDNVVKKYENLCFENSHVFSYSADISIIEDMFNSENYDLVLIDNKIKFSSAISVIKKIKSIKDNIIIILLIEKDIFDKDVSKNINGFITEDFDEDLILTTLNINLRMRNSLQKLSDTNKDLADSLYRLNTLYNTSSQFAGTLDKEKLIDYTIEGLDKSLSFSLTCTLSFCNYNEPVLILNSLYEISDELMNAIKLRTVLN